MIVDREKVHFDSWKAEVTGRTQIRVEAKKHAKFECFTPVLGQFLSDFVRVKSDVSPIFTGNFDRTTPLRRSSR